MKLLLAIAWDYTAPVDIHSVMSWHTVLEQTVTNIVSHITIFSPSIASKKNRKLLLMVFGSDNVQLVLAMVNGSMPLMVDYPNDN